MVTENCVGILSFNKKNLTKRCVNSVLDAGIVPDTVFLLHNGSEYSAQVELENLYPSINHRSIDQNRGYSGGFNALMEWIFSSGSNSVLFLTNDTVITKGTHEACLNTGKETGSGIIVPTIYYIKYPDKIDSSGGFFDRQRFTLSHYHEEDLPLFLNPGEDYVPGTAFWITKNIFLKTNGMDESYHTYWEDADFSFRCHKAEIKIARSSDAKIFHGIGQTCHKKPLYTTFYFQRNRITFCKKFLSGKELERSLDAIKKDILEMKKKAELGNNLNKIEYLKELKDTLN